MVSISFGSQENVIRKMEAINAVLVRRAKKVRIFGATGWDMVHVGVGWLSALIQLKVRIWDFAAAALILSERGGIADVRLNPDGSRRVIAAPPSLHKPLCDIVNGIV